MAPEGNHWRYTVTCNGTGWDGEVIHEGARGNEHEAPGCCGHCFSNAQDLI
jgi:hypothetical protein